ncbi:hypothetical protein BN874_540011 [Candidatus Contendobacter odensis Run_B_J11]|uniref:Uncharacterized protein n=1 Tax=Candidatus Contendobacter odensis Run_B_J11 TaxID=1400861 RepID=A0A7U7J4V0_9GAMM|nr:hypothetical protein BN874_540011 [Candidatus Contendobacter odensis Run_B_J11]
MFVKARLGIRAAQHPFQHITLRRFLVDPVTSPGGIHQHVELMALNLGQGRGQVGDRDELDVAGLEKIAIAPAIGSAQHPHFIEIQPRPGESDGETGNQRDREQQVPGQCGSVA